MNDMFARAGAFAHAVYAFLQTHPEIAVPLMGALFTFLAKPRTPEEYERIAKVSPRLAALLQLLAALFPDPVKAWKVGAKLLGGKNDGGKSLPPPPPPALPVLLFVLCMPILSGCAFLEKHAKDALSVAQDSKVAEVCEIADDYFEPMQKILADARKKSDEVAAQAVQSTREAHCGKRLTP